MIRKLFSSQLRINMVSGVVATVANVVALAIAYPIYLHILGYEKYGVWLGLCCWKSDLSSAVLLFEVSCTSFKELSC